MASEAVLSGYMERLEEIRQRKAAIELEVKQLSQNPTEADSAFEQLLEEAQNLVDEYNEYASKIEQLVPTSTDEVEDATEIGFGLH